MPRESTPNERAADAKKKVTSVRRKYKLNVNKPRKLHDKEVAHVADMVVVLKLASYSNTQIGKIVGLSRGQVKEFLDDPAMQARMVDLRASLPAAALDLLQGYLIEAVQALVDVMRRTDDDGLIIKAAGEILDRAGIPKSSRQERKVEESQVTVFTDDGIVEALREASPEVQEQAAQMIENLQDFLKQASSGEADAD